MKTKYTSFKVRAKRDRIRESYNTVHKLQIYYRSDFSDKQPFTISHHQ